MCFQKLEVHCQAPACEGSSRHPSEGLNKPTGACGAEGRSWPAQLEQQGKTHLESVLQVLGLQALPRGQRGVHAGGKCRNAFRLLSSFLLRSKGDTFSILQEKVPAFSLSTWHMPKRNSNRTHDPHSFRTASRWRARHLQKIYPWTCRERSPRQRWAQAPSPSRATKARTAWMH